jgi:hypothetical protein
VSTLSKEIRVANFNKENLHFGKSGLGFMVYLSLSSLFQPRKDSHTCEGETVARVTGRGEEVACVSRTVCTTRADGTADVGKPYRMTSIGYSKFASWKGFPKFLLKL